MAPDPDPRDAAPGRPPPPGSRPTEIAAFLIGHSLQADLGDFLLGFAASRGDLEFRFKEQFIPGAPLSFQLQAMRDGAGGFDPLFRGLFDRLYEAEDFDHLILLESVPRGTDLIFETLRDATTIATMAVEMNPDSRIYVYEPWHCIASGDPNRCDSDTSSPTRGLPWLERLDADRPMWRSVVDHLNANVEGLAHPVRMIPGGSALGAAVRAAQRGEIPGFSRVEDFFADRIHPNLYGMYVVACAHFATLYGRSPVGLPSDFGDRHGQPLFDGVRGDGTNYPSPSPEVRAALQRIAWDVVQSEPYAGLE